MSDQTDRVGKNEALFREVNERIDQLQEDLGGTPSFQVVCECGDAACTARFSITSDGYREVREDDRRFAVLPGHERQEIERVIAERAGYFLVEKTDPDAAAAAERTA